jgi:hypothetical protein
LEWHRQDVDAPVLPRLETTLLLADAQRLAGELPAAESTLLTARAALGGLDETDRLRVDASIHRRLASIHVDQRRMTEAADELLHALRCVGSVEPANGIDADEWIEVWLDIASFDYYSNGTFGWAAGAIDIINDAVGRRKNLREIVRLNQAIASRGMRTTRFTGPDHVVAFGHHHHELAKELGDLALLAEATFGVGFAYLCRLDGPNASRYFEEARSGYERSGDRLWLGLAMTYGAVSRRLCGDVDGTVAMTRQALDFGSGFMPPAYLAMLAANNLWALLRRGSEGSPTVDSVDLTARHPRRIAISDLTLPDDMLTDAAPFVASVLANLAHPSVADIYPFKGFLLWPVIVIADRQRDHALIADLASRIVHPIAQQLPPTIEAHVRTLASDPTNPCLAEALTWARSVSLI